MEYKLCDLQRDLLYIINKINKSEKNYNKNDEELLLKYTEELRAFCDYAEMTNDYKLHKEILNEH